MNIKKAVIPVAGLGTRMLPATKAIPKEMLPIVDKPLIQYVVNEAVAAGIKEIVLVTHSSKNAIENHFDKSFELEARLEKRVKRSLLEDVRSIVPKGVTVISVRQSEPLGLGHAVLTAKPIIGDHAFVVLLPDVLVDKYNSDLSKDNLAQMIKRFEQTQHSQIMVEPVPDDQVNQYGVVGLGGAKIQAGESRKVLGVVEKPDLDKAPSNLAITGRYVLSADIWDLLEKTMPGAGGEIQLTDALHGLDTMEAYHIKGKSHDCGSKVGYMMANIEYALKCSVLGEEFYSKLHSYLAIEEAKKSAEKRNVGQRDRREV